MSDENDEMQDHLRDTTDVMIEVNRALNDLRLRAEGAGSTSHRERIRHSRPRALAITKLEEALMWLQKDADEITGILKRG